MGGTLHWAMVRPSEATIVVGAGLVPPWEKVVHPLRPETRRWGSSGGAARPTNEWWTNLVVGEAAAVVTPYAVRGRGRALEIGYGPPRRITTATSVSEPFAADVTLGFSSTSDSPGLELVGYDELTARFRVSSGRSLRRRCVFYLARGSPYVTAEVEGRGEPVSLSGVVSVASDTVEAVECSAHEACAGLLGACCPTTKGLFLDCCSSSSVRVSAKSFALVSSDGSLWRLYASPRAAVATSGDGTATVTDPDGRSYVGVLRIARVPGTASLDAIAALDEHSRSYAISSNASFSDGRMTFGWRTKGSGSLAMLALPHHDLVDSSAEEPRLFGYASIKGDLRAFVGDEWTMRVDAPNADWLAPRSSRDAAAVELLVHSDVGNLHSTDELALAKATGVYASGKRATRFASLAIAARGVGLEDQARLAASAAADAVAPWLGPDLLVYDDTYGGVVTAAGVADEGADFGNGWYNDHHYHYGYLLYAAAVALDILGPNAFDARVPTADEKTWRRQTSLQGPAGRALASLVADVASRRPSRYFPFARHKDLYDGHSWASGLFDMNDGRSQESVSEAIHCYYAVSLLADVADDPDLKIFADILLGLELTAASSYWHDPDHAIYPPPFSSTNLIAAVVGASDVSASTWFAQGPAYAHLVNALPFTPVTEFLLKPHAYVAAAADDVAAALAFSDDSDKALAPWRALYVQFRAVVDPDKAARDILSLALSDDHGPHLLDTSQTLAAMMYWTTTRPPAYPTAQGDANSLFPTSHPTVHVDPPPQLATCADHPDCVNLGLTTGDCCPTPEAKVLWCCDASR